MNSTNWQEIDPVDFVRQCARWHHGDDGTCVSGLYNRRMDEACCFFTDNYPKRGWFAAEKPIWWEVCRKNGQTNSWFDDAAYADWYPRNVINYITDNKVY